MNRKELLARIGRQLNKADTLDSRTQARLLDHLNNVHRRILSSPGCQGLRRRQFSFTSNAGQSRYAFGHGENIKHIRDLTNDRELAQRSLPTYRQYNADPTQTQGTPDGYIQYGFEPVQTQPRDLSSVPPLLFVKSTSAADTTQTVYLEANTTLTSATLTGTTAVSLGGPWAFLDKFYLSAPTVGIVTLHADSGTGTVLSSLFQQTSVQWLALYLDPTPSQSLTYAVDAEFLITDLAQDTDTPDIPSDFHDLLEVGAIVDELLHTDDTRLVVLQQQYQRRLGELKLKLARQGTDSGPRGMSSRLGPWAPHTSW